MALIFLLALIVSLTCLTCQRKTGAILCLLVIFPEILGIIFHKAGLLGFNMMARYALLGTIILINIRNIDCYFSNLWKNPLSTFLYIFTFVMILHNYFIVGGANTNPNIASFQLNVILRIIIPYSVLLIVCRATENLNEFCKWIPFWGVAFIVVFVVLLGIDGINISNRMTIEEETGVNSISLSRFSAITLLSSLVYFLYNETKKNIFIYRLSQLLCLCSY